MVSVRASNQLSLNYKTDPTPHVRSWLAQQPCDTIDTPPEHLAVRGTLPISHVSSGSLVERAWARLTGRAFSVFPPARGTNTPLGLVRVYYRQGLDGVVNALWRGAQPQEEFSYGWVAGQLVICLRSPELLHAAFSDNSSHTSRLFPDHEGPFGGIYRIFGNNIFTMHNDQMRRARHVVLHRFFLKHSIANHFDKICATADLHIDALLASPERATRDVGKCMVAFTMDTWCRAQLGMPGLEPKAAMRLSEAISEGEALATSASHLIWRGVLQRLGLRPLSTTDATEMALREKLSQAMHDELIDPHRKALETSDNLMRALADNEAAAGRDGALDSDAVMAQTAILLLTGHETAASLLTWTLCELARNPSALVSLRSEVQRIFGSASPSREAIARTPYLDNVLNEALRLHPPAPYLGRTVTEAFSLPTRHGPVTLPKGAMLTTSLIAQHRIPEIWGEDAEAFKPERFEPLSRDHLKAHFVPFAVGERRCAGYPFALLEAKVFLVRLLQRTDFCIPKAPQIKPVYVGVLKTAEPLRMEVAKRVAP